MHTITLYRSREPAVWMAIFTDPATIQLFGTSTIPTAWRAHMNEEIVAAAIAKTNPGVKIMILGTDGILHEYAPAAAVPQEPPTTTAQPYTVLLLYPDYLADQYGEETYLAHVVAGSAARAIEAAQQQAARAQAPDAVNDESDFYPLLVLKGDHIDAREH